MKQIENTISDIKEYRVIKDTFLSPYDKNYDIFLKEEETLEKDLGTGPKCLR